MNTILPSNNWEHSLDEEYYHSKGLGQLLDLCQDIEKNPSQVHCSCKHKDAPQTPEIDWNAFLGRIDTMAQEDRVKNSSFRQCRLALNALEGDLTYDNRSRAKRLLRTAVDTLECEEKMSKKRRKEDMEAMKEEQEMFVVSTYLTYEFWNNIPQERSEELPCKAVRLEKLKKMQDRTLDEEKRRYEELKISEYLKKVSISLDPNREEPAELVKMLF